VFSAGVETPGVNPRAIKTMAEDGVDISNHTSNNVNEYLGISFDMIFTVCDNAKENCPFIPGNAIRIHHSFADPAKASGTEEDILQHFRSVRDEIKSYCKVLSEKYFL
jgi:arsenate reductase